MFLNKLNLINCKILYFYFTAKIIIHTVKKNRNIEMQKFLVVAPLNTVLNWEQEFEKWLPEAEKIRVSSPAFVFFALTTFFVQ